MELYLCNLSISVTFIDTLRRRQGILPPSQAVEKVVCKKKLHKEEEGVCPLEAGMALSSWYLAACGPRFFMIYCPRRARRSRISRSAERDQGSAFGIRDFLKKIE